MSTSLIFEVVPKKSFNPEGLKMDVVTDWVNDYPSECASQFLNAHHSFEARCVVGKALAALEVSGGGHAQIPNCLVTDGVFVSKQLAETIYQLSLTHDGWDPKNKQDGITRWGFEGQLKEVIAGLDFDNHHLVIKVG